MLSILKRDRNPIVSILEGVAMGLTIKDGATEKEITGLVAIEATGEGTPDIDISQISLTVDGGASPDWQEVWSKNTGSIKTAIIADPRNAGIIFGSQAVIIIPRKPVWVNGVADEGKFTVNMPDLGGGFANVTDYLYGSTKVAGGDTSIWTGVTSFDVYRGVAALDLFKATYDIDTMEYALGKTIEQLTAQHDVPCVIALPRTWYIFGHELQPWVTNDLVNLRLNTTFTTAPIQTDNGDARVPWADMADVPVVNATAYTWTPDLMPGISGWGFATDVSYRGLVSEGTDGNRVPLADRNFRRWKMFPENPELGSIPDNFADLIFVKGVPLGTSGISASGANAHYGERGYPSYPWPSTPTSISGGAFAVKRASAPTFGSTVKYEDLLAQSTTLTATENQGVWFVHGTYPPTSILPRARPHGMGWHSYVRAPIDSTDSAALIHLKQNGIGNTDTFNFRVRARGNDRNIEAPAGNDSPVSALTPNKNVVAMWTHVGSFIGTPVPDSHYKAMGASKVDLAGADTGFETIKVPFRLNGAVDFDPAFGGSDPMVANERSSSYLGSGGGQYSTTGFVAFGISQGEEWLIATELSINEKKINRCMEFASNRVPVALDCLMGGDRRSVYVIFNQLLTGDALSSLDAAFRFNPAPSFEFSTFEHFESIELTTMAGIYTVVKLTTGEELSDATSLAFMPQFSELVSVDGVKPCGFNYMKARIISENVSLVPYSGVNLRTQFVNKYPLLDTLPLLVKFNQIADITLMPVNAEYFQTGIWPGGTTLQLLKANRLLKGSDGDSDQPGAYGPAITTSVPLEIDNSNGSINAGQWMGSGAYAPAINGMEFVKFIGTNTGTLNGVAASTYIINVPYNARNVNLRTLFTTAYPSVSGAVSVQFNQNFSVGSSVRTTPAMTTGNWPAGSTLTLLKPSVATRGMGGRGAGWDASHTPVAGEDGGTALEVLYPIAIDNYNGSIDGAGGGGGRASYTVGTTIDYAGGGGAGVEAGAGGPSSDVPGFDGGDQFGGTGNGAVHGDAYYIDIKGGNLGEPGSGTAAGAAGKSIIGLGMVTWIRTGTVNGPTIS